ncbi:nuclear transport factor 2 family protein [Williamsia soli]|uniref:nuclear transport factor 2 family protein n=1 Tax=Williamsia soli TaxID=364929 RepID=UPI001A9E9102|nr:nuclear transport factor 2 family protein [Williamsia soli]
MMISSQAVHDVLAAFWFDVDHRDGVGAHLFFVADGELAFESARFRGRDEIRAVYADRVARGPRVSRHVMSNVHVVSREDDSVEVVSSVCLYAQDGHAPGSRVIPVGVSDVFDQLVSTSDGLLIVSRSIVNQFVSSDAEFAVPMQARVANVSERLER